MKQEFELNPDEGDGAVALRGVMEALGSRTADPPPSARAAARAALTAASMSIEISCMLAMLSTFLRCLRGLTKQQQPGAPLPCGAASDLLLRALKPKWLRIH